MSFYSKCFTATERIYSTFDRELLAIKLALKHFMYVLQDKHFIIYTDHKPLVNIMRAPSPDWSDGVVRTVDHLSRFSFELSHIGGKSNVVVTISQGWSRS